MRKQRSMLGLAGCRGRGCGGSDKSGKGAQASVGADVRGRNVSGRQCNWARPSLSGRKSVSRGRWVRRQAASGGTGRDDGFRFDDGRPSARSREGHSLFDVESTGSSTSEASRIRPRHSSYGGGTLGLDDRPVERRTLRSVDVR